MSKARLGDYITDLSVNEMKKIDKAISVSLGIYHHFQTLKNKYDDKIKYIEALKKKRDELTGNCAIKQEKIDEIYNLMNKFKISTIKDLEKVLNNLSN